MISVIWAQPRALREGVEQLLQGCEGLTLILTSGTPVGIPHEVPRNLYIYIYSVIF